MFKAKILDLAQPPGPHSVSQFPKQGGMILLEFIIALVITVSLTILLFSVTYSLFTVSVTQYVAFATARAYSLGGLSPDTQADNARAKFSSLAQGQSAIASLYQSGWFEIAGPGQLDLRGGASSDNGQTFGQDFDSSGSHPSRALGVSIPLGLTILRSNLPLLGPTDPDDDDSSFRTRLNAFLIRDPSQKECQDFMEARRQALTQLPSGRSWATSIQQDYFPMEDNGC